MVINSTPTLSLSSSVAQNLPLLRHVFETIQADSCPHFYNFHMHTVHSDGRLQPQDLIDQAIKIGLLGLAITDHHSITGYKVAQGYLEDFRAENVSPLPHLWTGIEITSDLVGTEVHILGYAFDPAHPHLVPYIQGYGPFDKYAQADNVIAAIHQAGGLAVLAHPMRYRTPAEYLIDAAADLGIDGIEVYYAYNNPNPWIPSPKETEKVTELAAKYNLLQTCGTDTHGLNLLQRI